MKEKEIEVVMLPSAIPGQLDKLEKHLEETSLFNVNFVSPDAPATDKPRFVITPYTPSAENTTELSEGAVTLAKELSANQDDPFYYILVGNITFENLIHAFSAPIFDDAYNLDRLDDIEEKGNNFAQRLNGLLDGQPRHLTTQD